VLGPLPFAPHLDSRRLVGHLNSGLSFISVLPAGTGSTTGTNIQVAYVETDLCLRRLFEYGDRYGRRLYAPTFLIWRHALKPMTAPFTCERGFGIPSRSSEQEEAWPFI